MSNTNTIRERVKVILAYVAVILLAVFLGLVVLDSIPKRSVSDDLGEYDSLINEIQKERVYRDSLAVKINAMSEKIDREEEANRATINQVNHLNKKLSNIQSEYEKIKDYSNYDSDSIFLYFKRRNTTQ